MCNDPATSWPVVIQFTSIDAQTCIEASYVAIHTSPYHPHSCQVIMLVLQTHPQRRYQLRKDQSAGGIVFYANPLIHGFPWSVPDTIANKHVLLSLKKQPFRRYKGSDGALVQTVKRLQNAAEVQRTVNSSSTANANSCLGSWKRAHRVPSLGRV